ncbi:beta strand repeat-containing protein, partial [Labrys miyagiensis]|uniref:beta strand repeat-containing protein n=1 Tax=Labrys miyagiensis TaxID=346912 RepID=UPI0024E07885
FSQNISGISTTGAVGAATAQTTVAGALTALDANTTNLANIAVKYDAPGGNKITLGATGGAGAGAPVTITNLANGAVTSTSTDAVNGSQLNAVATTANKGWNLSTNKGATTSNIAPGGTVDLSNTDNNIVIGQSGPNATFNLASTVAIASSLTVGGTTKLDNTGLTITGGPSVTTAGIDAANTKISNLQAGTAATDAVNLSQLNAVASSATTNLDNLGNSTASTLGGGTTFNTTTGTLSGFSQNISGISTTGAVGAATAQTTVAGALTALDANTTNLANIAVKYDAPGGNKITLGATGGAGAGAPVTITNLANGAVTSTSTDAVNGSQLNAVNVTANKGWNVSSNNGTTTSKVAPGDTVDFNNSDNNLVVSQTGNSLTFNLANTVTIGSTTINAAGVSIAGGPSLTTGGVDAGGKKITNLQAGTAATDAVNVSQLNAVGGNTNNLGNSIATNLGGGSTYNTTTGTVSAPTYTIGGNTYNTVGDAFSAINTTGIKYFHANSTKGDSQANGTDSIAVGPNAVATAAGTGAIAMGLDSNASAAGAMAIGQAAAASGTNGIAMGVSAVSGATGQNVAIGAGANANAATAGGGAVSIGLGNTAQGDGAVAIGDPNSAIGTGAVAMGANNTANGQGAIALGNTSTATGQGSFAAGNNSKAGAAGAVALGDTALGAAANTVALGSGAKANNANDVALGSGSTTAAVVNTAGATIAGTAYTFAGTNANSTVSVGTAGAERTVTNVAAGQVTATSTDAVNGSQLFATNQAVNAVSTSITTIGGNINNLGTTTASTMGGGATFDPTTGKITGFTQNIAPISTTGGVGAAVPQTTVADALTALDSNSTNLANIAVKYDDPSQTKITLGATGGAGAGAPVSITNLANGTVAAGSSDAVNGSQLFAVQQQASAGWDLGTNGGLGVNVAPGSKVDLSSTPDGNIVISQNGTNVTFGLAANLAVAGSLTVGNTKVDTNGLTINGGPSVTTNGIDGGGKKITNVQAGTAPTDVATVSQLQTIGNATSNLGNSVATNLGGGTTYNTATGTLSGFSQSIAPVSTTGKVGAAAPQTTVAGALAALDTNTTNLANVAVKYDDPSQTKITLGATGGAGAGAPVTITNLANGAVASTSTDAVNGSQLFATNTTISNLGNSTANGLGGGSSYDPTTGTLTTALNYGGSTYSSVQGVIDQIGGSLNGGGIKYFHANSTKGDSQANGTDSIAVGPNAVATAAGTGAIAMGLDSNASAAGAMALGQSASASGANGIAMGVSAVSGATGQNVAIGAGANANAATAGGGAVSIGAGNIAQGDGAVAIGDPNSAIGTGAVALGANNTANGQGAVALGNTSTANGQGAVALGNTSKATGQGSFAAGSNSNAAAAGAVALGDTALGAAANTVALGSGAKANNANDVALGSGSTTAAVVNTAGATIAGTAYTFAGTNATSTVSVGTAGAERTVTNVAAGQLSAASTDAVNGSQLYATNQAIQAVADNAVQYDTSNKNTITLGGANGTTISNVANGTVNATSTQAVNGSQLYAVQQQISTAGWNLLTPDTANNHVGPNGTVEMTSTDNNMVISQTQTATGTKVDYKLSNTVNVADKLTVGGANGTSITATGLTIANGGPSITTSGIYAGKQKITGVGAGTISAASTDAVNGSQLYGTAQSVANALGGGSKVDGNGQITGTSYTVGGKAYNNVGGAITALDAQFNGIGSSISNLQSQISHNQNEARSGIAQAMAASALRYDDRPGKISAAAGMSVYHSQVGIAAGVGWTSEDAKWRANLAGTYSPSARKPDFGIMGGLSYTFN